MSDHARMNELITNLCLGIVSDEERKRQEQAEELHRAITEQFIARESAREQEPHSDR